jgi:hypothetical protein
MRAKIKKNPCRSAGIFEIPDQVRNDEPSTGHQASMGLYFGTRAFMMLQAMR